MPIPSAMPPPPPTGVTRSSLQKAALSVGVAFVLLGMLGTFNVLVEHDIVYLAFGVAGVALARRFGTARAYLIGGGIVYLVLFIHGLVTDSANWLHLGLAAGMLVLGVVLSRGRGAAPTRRSMGLPPKTPKVAR